MSKYRSASHVSVYNYPEHLNPFYEDEQHKRLRFWKIKTSSKSNENKSNGGGLRRGSFNLGSLRELFPLKSFRMKKRSSALGVNQTSESPPALRRDFIGYNKEDEDRYASYDPHFRHTGGVENFPRNAAYRSSLQNMSGSNSGDFLTFNRNNRYRNTMQNGSGAKNDRYVYSGSMTPQPKSRYLTDITPRMTPGSSMNSVSTNPFDDDEDEIEEHVELSTSNTLEVTKVQKASKPPRKKKRQAPPPPPSQKQMLGANSADEEVEKVELRVTERDGLEELSRMTREFENFVKHTNDDGKSHEPRILLNGEEIKKHETIEKSERIVEVPKTPSEEENQNAKVSVEITIQNVDAAVEEKSTTMLIENEADELETKQVIRKPEIIKQNASEKIKVASPCVVEIKEHEFQTPRPIPLEFKTTDIKATEVKIVELKAPQAETPQIRNIDEQKNTSLQCQIEIVEEEEKREVIETPHIVINEVLKIDEPQIHVKESSPTIETITSEVQQLLTEIRSFPEFQRLTPTPTPSREETPEYIPITVREKFHVKLRIEEDEIAPQPSTPSKEIFMEKEIKKEVPQSPKSEARIIRDTTPIPLARTEVEEKLSSQGFRKVTKSEFLKLDEIENVEIRRKDSTDELIIREGDELPKVPERRRSVKEIIESINKHQQKLKINQPPTPQFERKFYYGESQKFSYHEKPAVPSKENVLLKLKRQEDHERRINELLEDLQGYSNREMTTFRTQKFPLTDRDSNNNNNNNSFPPNHKSSTNEVNPIPKPRRVL